MNSDQGFAQHQDHDDVHIALENPPGTEVVDALTLAATNAEPTAQDDPGPASWQIVEHSQNEDEHVGQAALPIAGTNGPGMVEFDSDSGYAQSADELLDWSSITSSILDYQYVNGRRYNAFRYGHYYMPNDEKEQDYMDLFHHVCLLLLDGGLYCAPLQRPSSILDVGTGTGIWAMDVADKFPEAVVIGTDLSPIQPSWTPPNLHFLVDDCEDDWLFDSTFDFIHARNLAGSLRDWPKFFRQAYDHLNPGSWIEVSAIGFPSTARDGGVFPGSSALRLNALVRQASEAAGRKLDMNPDMQDLMVAAGFENVSQVKRVAPASSWLPGRRFREIAAYSQPLLCGEIEGTTLLLFSQQLGWSYEEILVFLAHVRAEYKNKELKFYQEMIWTIGRKPNCG